MSGQEEATKKCPLCGETIPASADICPSCGAHLDIFELEEEFSETDTSPLESFLESIGDAEDVDPEKILEEMQSIMGSGPSGDEDIAEENHESEEKAPEEADTAAGADTGTDEGTVEEEVEYVCPVCEKPVGEEDLICPHCGAIFVEDEEDMAILLEEQLAQAKELVKKMRSLGMNVSEVTPYLKNANISKRKGNTEEALENAIACVMAAKKKLDAS